jgi:hypothetical protein
MPGRNPFLIAKDYLNPNESVQVRKNAVTALAALDDEESRALLAEKAVTDESAEVKQKARDEIADMPVESSQQILKLVLRDLSVEDRQRTAYIMLGELRNKGLKFKFPSISLFARIGLAKDMRDHLYPRRGARFWFRTLPGTLFGVVVSWVGVLLFCAGLKLLPDMATSLVFLLLAGLLTIAVAIGATFLSSPARLYPDWIGSALLQMGIAAGIVFVLAVLALLIAMANVNDLRPYFLLLCAPAVAAAVRAGTLAAFGLAEPRLLNRIIQTLVGGTCGVAVYELLIIATRKNQIGFYAGVWQWIVLASYGLAAAYAWIDSTSKPRRVVPRLLTATTILVFLLCAIFNLAQLIPPKEQDLQGKGSQRAAESATDLGTIQDDFRSIPISHLPATFTFSIPRRVMLSASLNPSYAGYLSLTPINTSDVHEPYVIQYLDPDTEYKLTAVPSPQGQHPNIFSETKLVKKMSWTEFKQKVKRVPVAEDEPRVAVRLNLQFQ